MLLLDKVKWQQLSESHRVRLLVGFSNRVPNIGLPMDNSTEMPGTGSG